MSDMREKADAAVKVLPPDLQEIIWVAAAAGAGYRYASDPAASIDIFQATANSLAIELATFMAGRVKGPKD